MDPDNILPPTTRQSSCSLLEAHNDVFDPTITGYNGAVGPFEAVVYMGPVQPPPFRHYTEIYHSTTTIRSTLDRY